MESALCGFQLRMTETTCSMAQRVEALEAGIAMSVLKRAADSMSEPTKGWHNEPRTGELKDVVASVMDLEARFELFRENTTAQIASSTAELNKLREEDVSKTCLPTEDLRACLLNASSHVMHLERLREKWHETQVPQVCNSSEEHFEEAVRDAVSKCLREVLPPKQLRDWWQSNYNCCPVSLNASTSSGNIVAEKAGIMSMAAQQLVHRRITDQALPLSCAASVFPAVPASCDKAASVPQIGHSEWNVHFSSQMLNALEPAPQTILPCTNGEDTFAANSIADVSSHNSSTISLSTATNISDTFSTQNPLCSTSKSEKTGSQVLQASGSPITGEPCRLCTLQAQSINTRMLVMSPHAFARQVKPPATLLFRPNVALPVLRCKLPLAGGIQMQPSPRSPQCPESITSRIVQLPVSPRLEVR